MLYRSLFIIIVIVIIIIIVKETCRIYSVPYVVQLFGALTDLGEKCANCFALLPPPLPED